MWRWRLVRRGDDPTDQAEHVLRLESRIQQLQMEAADRDRTSARVQAELERERARNRAEETARGAAARMAEALATPVVQVLTLAHLSESGTTDPSAGDALAAALRLVRALERCGVEVLCAVGEHVVFDPVRHDPLSATRAVRAGEPAVVRVVGLTFDGRVLRKAAVEATVG